MAYSGSTAASSVANPPIQLVKGVANTTNTGSTTLAGNGVWFYSSTNGSTECHATSFFTDAYYLGMKAGDVIIGVSNTGSSVHTWVGVVGAVTTAGAATNASLIAST